MQSKRCVICKKPNDLVNLYEGIFEDEMIMVCSECANEEKIPILKKPSKDQLDLADRHFSVRERMERMSGLRKNSQNGSGERLTSQNNFNKLRMPTPKQKHEDVVDNYYWEINMARRRKKITLNQLSIKTSIPLEVLEALESGQLPKDFETYLVNLEDYFGIKLLKQHKQRVRYLIPQVDEEKILNDVRVKMETKTIEDDNDLEDLDKLRKEEKLKELEEGELDLSNRKDLNDITLDDLVALKKKKEEKERQKALRKKTEDLIGDDLDIEFE